ncbi:MAG: hypothetical protein EOO77_30645, partial [Oxalobacteraceae bacterium]
SYGLTGARANRPPAVVAAALSAAGIACLDNGFVGDNGVQAANNFALSSYDSRFTLGEGHISAQYHNFAGGSFLAVGYPSTHFKPVGSYDRAVLTVYRSGNWGIDFTANDMDNGPKFGTSHLDVTPVGGFLAATFGLNSPGEFEGAMAGDATKTAVRSLYVYNSAVPAIDTLVHAACGANSSDQAASSAGTSTQNWSNLEALKFDAPDLTIINLGLNNMNGNNPVANYRTDLQAIITAAKISGDVLLLFPHPAGGNYNQNVAGYHAAAKQLAADNGVAFFSLYEYLGGAFTTSLGNRMFDGIVHPNAELYAEIGARITDAIKLMVINRGVFA